MEHKKILQFTGVIAGLGIGSMLISMSDVPYPLNVYIMIGIAVLMLLLIVKFIYDFFTTNQSTPAVYYPDISGKKIFFISPYRSTTLSVIMIVFPMLFFYLFVQLSPMIIKDIQTESVITVIILSVLSVIVLFASLYCFFTGVKLFMRRKKIVQLIIDNDSLEFFPIYDFGTTARSTNAISMFFRKKMQKVYFTDQLTVEIIKDKWLGNKIRMHVEGVGFYLPYLYNDMNELEEVYQTIQQRLQKVVHGKR